MNMNAAGYYIVRIDWSSTDNCYVVVKASSESEASRLARGCYPRAAYVTVESRVERIIYMGG